LAQRVSPLNKWRGKVYRFARKKGGDWVAIHDRLRRKVVGIKNIRTMKKMVSVLLLWGTLLPVAAQQPLSLDSCRALALRNNKQINAAKFKQEIALQLRKAAKTKYLPKVDVVGGYQYFSESVSLLSKDQKDALNHLGTGVTAAAGGNLSSLLTNMVAHGVISPSVAGQISNVFSQVSGPMAGMGNQVGQNIVNSLETNTHHMWGGAVVVRQPIYMGGAITALNRMAELNERVAENDANAKRQATLYNVDQAYWMVVSLKQKQQLANSYLALVQKLSGDVQKMFQEGVATKADGLKVDVRVNEAEMQVTQVEDGLVLAKMLLCQLCGLPLEERVSLVDEQPLQRGLNLDAQPQAVADKGLANENRPELRMLQNMVDLTRQGERLVRAIYLPHVLLTGGYFASNPNVFNGFERKLAGTWNVGVLVQVPVWNWFEGAYKVRAAKAATSFAQMELSDAQEKISLQISQCQFKVKEAHKRLVMARKNIHSAEENLRCATLGFKEGVIESTDVLAAQAAWQQAKSQEIDAEVEVRLSQVNLQKALGVLQY